MLLKSTLNPVAAPPITAASMTSTAPHHKVRVFPRTAIDSGEIEGIHNRTDYDLSRHQEYSGKSLQYFDEQAKEKFTPYIIETSAGASRSFMAFLVDAYREEEAPTADGKMDLRTVMRFNPGLRQSRQQSSLS